MSFRKSSALVWLGAAACLGGVESQLGGGQGDPGSGDSLAGDPAGGGDTVVVPGVLTGLRFLTQPDGAAAHAPWVTQPQIETIDGAGDRVEATGVVTVSGVDGSGSLLGTTSVSLVGGVASFTDLAYTLAQEALTLRAEYRDLSQQSQPFDIVAEASGACLREDAGFVSADGGCLDTASGLVWGVASVAPLTWGEAVWDETVLGSAPRDSDDFERTNDYPEDEPPCLGACDDAAPAYCKNLTQGGRSDWRLPSALELGNLFQNGLAGQPPYVSFVTVGPLLTSSTALNTDNAVTLNVADGASVALSKDSELRVVCVRGNRTDEVRVSIAESPLTLGVGSRPPRPLVVALTTPEGAQVNGQGSLVTLSLQNSGGVIGLATAQSDSGGRVSFGQWTIGVAGPQTLIAAIAGTLESTSLDVTVGPFPHTCSVEDGDFETSSGGCRDLSTGLVWSLQSPEALSWHEAVWDQTSPVGNSVAELSDAGESNDYDNSPGAHPDASLLNYCHDVTEGGFSDWRLPSVFELGLAFGMGAGSPAHFAVDTNQVFVSSTTATSADTAQTVNLMSGAMAAQSKDLPGAVICVRDASSGP